jgi:hypothetical protein
MRLVFNEVADRLFASASLDKTRHRHLSLSNQPLTIRSNPCRATLEVVVLSPAARLCGPLKNPIQNAKLGSFRHFPHRLPNGFVPQIARCQDDAEHARTIVLHWPGYIAVALQWQQAIDYEVVNHKLGSFRHFPHRLSNGFVP